MLKSLTIITNKNPIFLTQINIQIGHFRVILQFIIIFNANINE